MIIPVVQREEASVRKEKCRFRRPGEDNYLLDLLVATRLSHFCQVVFSKRVVAQLSQLKQ